MAQDDDPVDDVQATAMIAGASTLKMAEAAARAAQVRVEKIAEGHTAATGRWPAALSRADVDKVPIGDSVVSLRDGTRYERVDTYATVDGHQVPVSWRDPATGRGSGLEDANSRILDYAGPLYAGDGPEAARIFADKMNGADPAKAAASGASGPAPAVGRGRRPVRTVDRGR